VTVKLLNALTAFGCICLAQPASADAKTFMQPAAMATR